MNHNCAFEFKFWVLRGEFWNLISNYSQLRLYEMYSMNSKISKCKEWEFKIHPQILSSNWHDSFEIQKQLKMGLRNEIHRHISSNELTYFPIV